jgi:hypothetical protein
MSATASSSVVPSAPVTPATTLALFSATVDTLAALGTPLPTVLALVLEAYGYDARSMHLEDTAGNTLMSAGFPHEVK